MPCRRMVSLAVLLLLGAGLAGGALGAAGCSRAAGPPAGAGAGPGSPSAGDDPEPGGDADLPPAAAGPLAAYAAEVMDLLTRGEVATLVTRLHPEFVEVVLVKDGGSDWQASVGSPDQVADALPVLRDWLRDREQLHATVLVIHNRHGDGYTVVEVPVQGGFFALGFDAERRISKLYISEGPLDWD